MDIAAMSMELSSTTLQSNVSVSVAKKAMEQQEVVAEGLMEMIPPSLTPGIGEHINVTA